MAGLVPNSMYGAPLPTPGEGVVPGPVPREISASAPSQGLPGPPPPAEPARAEELPDFDHEERADLVIGGGIYRGYVVKFTDEEISALRKIMVGAVVRTMESEMARLKEGT